MEKFNDRRREEKMTSESSITSGNNNNNIGKENQTGVKNAIDVIMSSIAQKRRTSGLFGSKRWWQPSCWASRSHQEAYLRKLYSRKYGNASDANSQNGSVNGGAGGGESDTSTVIENQGSRNNINNLNNNNNNSIRTKENWRAPVYDLPTSSEHYLDAFLRQRRESGPLCPALSTPRASPTEKCVEFLNRNKGEHSCDHQGNIDAA